MPMRVRTWVALESPAVDVDAVELDLPGDLRAGDHLVHAVEDPQERRLAAARRADRAR